MVYKKIETSSAIFSNISEDVAQEFIDHRINIKKPLTQGAFNRAMATAVKCEGLGISAEEAIAMIVDKGWQGITFEYVAAELNRRMTAIQEVRTSSQRTLLQTDKSTRGTTIQQDLNDRGWAN